MSQAVETSQKVASMLESIGDITATSMVTKEPIQGPVFTKRLKNGILGDGVNSATAAVFSTFPISFPTARLRGFCSQCYPCHFDWSGIKLRRCKY